jgi:glycosyltransferase involved in cell wall biosynthesis
MKFSLILSTKDRTREIVKLFEGFRSQTLQDFEIIVSDQNEDDRLVDLFAQIKWPGKLTYLRNTGGVSVGRNCGLARARGEIIGFPDDDCMYYPTWLQDVARFFDARAEYDYFSGRSIADDGRNAVSGHAKKAGKIRRYSIYSQCIEFAFFVRRSSLGDLRFDEKMGVGADSPWQSDEGPDLILNLEKKGVHGYYDPAFVVWHRRLELTYDDDMVMRCFRYACGSGYFLRKHRYPLWFILRMNLMSCGGAALGLLTLRPKKARFYWLRVCGRWQGWIGYEREHPLPESGTSHRPR